MRSGMRTGQHRLATLQRCSDSPEGRKGGQTTQEAGDDEGAGDSDAALEAVRARPIMRPPAN